MFFWFRCGYWCSFVVYRLIFEQAGNHYMSKFICKIDLLNFIFFPFRFTFKWFWKIYKCEWKKHVNIKQLSDKLWKKLWLENEFDEVVWVCIHTYTSTNKQTTLSNIFRTIFFCEWMFIVKTILDTLCYNNALAIAPIHQDYGKEVAFKNWHYNFRCIFVSFCVCVFKCVYIFVR